MANTCPNRNTKEWVRLESAVGEHEAYRLFIAYNEQIPELTDEQLQVYRDIMQQKKVLEKTLPHVKEVIIDPNLKGKSELTANHTVIKINPEYATKDTLFHEYGHVLVDSLGYDSRLVQNGLKHLRGTELWNDISDRYKNDPDYDEQKVEKEVLVQSIGVKSVKAFNQVNDKVKWLQWLNRFYTRIKALLGIEEAAVDDLVNRLVSIKPITIKNEIFTTQKQKLDKEAIDKIVDKLNSIKDKTKFDKNLKKFVDKNNPSAIYESTSRAISKVKGYGMEVKDESIKVLGEEASNIGSVIHKYLESKITDVEFNSLIEERLGYKLGLKARRSIDNLITKLKKDGHRLMSEVMVADEANMVIGVIDLITISPSGEVDIYDFKSREKGFDFYSAHTGKGKTMKEKHGLQLTIYKHLLEMSTPFKVRSQSVIRLQPGITKYTDKAGEHKSISNINILRSLRLPSNPDFIEVLKVNTNKNNNQTIVEAEKSIGKLQDIQRNMIKRLRTRLATIDRRREPKKYQELLLAIERGEEPGSVELGTITAFYKNAIHDINSVYNRYIEAKEQEASGEPSAFTLEKLQSWHDILSAYDMLDEYHRDLKEELMPKIRKNPDFKMAYEQMDNIYLAIEGGKDADGNVVKGLIEQYVAIKNIYTNKGMDLLVDYLADLSTVVEVEYRDEYTREYSRLPKSDKDRMSLEQYLDEKLGKDAEEIRENTKKRIYTDLQLASEDINGWRRWTDSVLSSPDLVVQSATKAYRIAAEEHRLDTKDKRNEIVDLNRKMEAQYGKMGYKSDREVYDYMLEQNDEGKYNGHILTEVKGELEDEYNKIMRDASGMTYEMGAKHVAKWKNENMPLNIDARNEALFKWLDTQKEFELKNKDRVSEWLGNRQLDLEEFIGWTKYNKVTSWLEDNTDTYREPADKWMNTNNPKYIELQKILADPNDTRGQFYKMFTEGMDESDLRVGHKDRLGTRLAGMEKTIGEAARSGFSAAEIAKLGLSKEFNVRADDEGIGVKVSVGAGDEIKYFLPVHFTKRLDDKMQSYDLATMLYQRYSNTLRYEKMNEILPQMLLTKEYLRTREMPKTAPGGKTIRAKITDAILKMKGDKSNIYRQFDDFLTLNMFQDQGLGEGEVNIFGVKLDNTKTINFLNKWTAHVMLGLNAYSGVSNVVFGESLQQMEALVGEYVGNKNMMKASSFYWRHFFDVMGDVGSRTPTSLLGKLSEELNFQADYSNAKLNQDTKFKSLVDTDSMMMFINSGEHYMQNRFGLGMLDRVEAKNSKGEVIGTMLEMYYLDKDGNLKIKDKVDLEKSKWTRQDRIAFTGKTREVLARLHGDYRPEARVGFQRYAMGRMIMAFRRFIPKSLQARYGKRQFNQTLEQFTEGRYITTGKFVKNLIKNLRHFKWEVASSNWNELSRHEKANIHRTIVEVGYAMMATLLLGIISNLRSGDDDEGLAFLQYQVLRWRSEILFFTDPVEMRRILKSPAAAMSMIENIEKFGKNLFFHYGDVYERGPWKGHHKWEKYGFNLIPYSKQWYRLKNVDDQLSWLER